MNDRTAHALTLVRQALSHYTDAPPESIQPDTVLADIDIDSLTLAELMFELEDRLDTHMPEAGTLPRLVSELVDLVLPHLDAHASQSAA